MQRGAKGKAYTSEEWEIFVAKLHARWSAKGYRSGVCWYLFYKLRKRSRDMDCTVDAPITKKNCGHGPHDPSGNGGSSAMATA